LNIFYQLTPEDLRANGFKGKGKLIADVAKENKQYIEGCLREMRNIQPDLKAALENALS
jgi:hypothetical protein